MAYQLISTPRPGPVGSPSTPFSKTYEQAVSTLVSTLDGTLDSTLDRHRKAQKEQLEATSRSI